LNEKEIGKTVSRAKAQRAPSSKKKKEFSLRSLRLGAMRFFCDHGRQHKMLAINSHISESKNSKIENSLKGQEHDLRR
jgi:hypothetical protein